ncbi:MAG: hypothetical protein AAGH15_04430 [Myxococcota bacterium]
MDISLTRTGPRTWTGDTPSGLIRLTHSAITGRFYFDGLDERSHRFLDWTGLAYQRFGTAEEACKALAGALAFRVIETALKEVA